MKYAQDALSPFNDLTFPFIAFKGGNGFSSLVRRLFGNLQIEDLWIPFFCISANLNRSELKVHTQGSLAKAVLATTRAPGIFPPVVYDGELHVDGGVINNVPVDIMKAFCNQGITIGIDVSPPHELNPVGDFHLAGEILSAGYECMKRNMVDWLSQAEALDRRPALAAVFQENANQALVLDEKAFSQAR